MIEGKKKKRKLMSELNKTNTRIKIKIRETHALIKNDSTK